MFLVERDGIPLTPLAGNLGGMPFRPTMQPHQLLESEGQS